jgi:hypothetical protein
MKGRGVGGKVCPLAGTCREELAGGRSNDGLPLPFVSYGGTSLVFSLAAVGLLIGIHRRSQVAVAEAFPLGKEVRLAVRL